MKRPGHWLRTAAARVCAKQTMERVVDPIVADIQTEHDEAARAGRGWRTAWIRVSGYSGFWKAVGLHALQSGPRFFWSGLADEGWALGRMMAYSLIAFVGVTLLLAVQPMIGHSSLIRSWAWATVLLLPQAIPISIPMALPLGIVCSIPGIRVRARRIRGLLVVAAAAALLAFASMLILPAANQAWRVLTAEELGLRGITKYSLPRGRNELSLFELTAGSQKYEADGHPETARAFRRTYHQRFALPVATLVLSLLALGICGTVRNRAVRIAALVAGVWVYYITLRLGDSKPLTTMLPPLVSVWTPNVVVAAVSLALLRLSHRHYKLNTRTSVLRSVLLFSLLSWTCPGTSAVADTSTCSPPLMGRIVTRTTARPPVGMAVPVVQRAPVGVGLQVIAIGKPVS